MFRPRIIPCLLLKSKGLVKTVKFGNPNYIGDPINAVRIFNDFEADELIFLDIDASKENRCVNLEFVKKIGEETFMPFAVGGGIKKIEEIRKVFNSGAEKVILNTGAIENSDLITKSSDIFGSQAIICAIDVRKEEGKYNVFTYGGTKNTKLEPTSVARISEKAGAGEILINSIDKDGTMEGYDLELIKNISRAVSIPVVALGGAGSLEDFGKAIKAGASAVSAGSLFVYSGKNKGILINYPDRKELDGIFE